MSIEYFLAWFAVVFPLIASPGPANIVFALSGAKQGFKKSIPLMLGIDLMFILGSILVGFGLGEFLQSYPTLMQLIKLLGIGYIFYMVYKFIKPTKKDNSNEEARVYTFYDGVILQIFNPKGWTLVFVTFSLFLDGSFDHTQQVIALILMIATFNILTHITWIMAGTFITRCIANPSNERIINTGFAASLLLVALWLLWDTLNEIVSTGINVPQLINFSFN
jgi:threonine/homoserine/homoserine lactone efflux protein